MGQIIDADDAVYVRAATLARRLDVHVSTLWRWVQLGRLPAPVRLGPGVTAWRWVDVERVLRTGDQR